MGMIFIVVQSVAVLWLGSYAWRGARQRWVTHVENTDLDSLNAELFLRQRLDGQSALAVTSTHWNSFGDRGTIHTAEGVSLSVRLFWAQPVELSHLIAARWRNDVGWLLSGVSQTGEPVQMCAWYVACHNND